MCSVVVVVVAAVAAHKEMKKSNIDSTLKSRSCNRVRGGGYMLGGYSLKIQVEKEEFHIWDKSKNLILY